MKVLFWAGVVMVILGILSFFISVPQTQQSGVRIGGMRAGVSTTYQEKLPPYVGVILIVGGIGTMLAGSKTPRH